MQRLFLYQVKVKTLAWEPVPGFLKHSLSRLLHPSISLSGGFSLTSPKGKVEYKDPRHCRQGPMGILVPAAH